MSYDSNPATQIGPEAPAATDEAFVVHIDWRRIVISVFVIWQVFAVTLWLLPEQPPRSAALPLVEQYMLTTGCWQQWTMFSPSPARLDAFVEARADYADGTHRSWSFQRTHDLSLVRRYQQERYRKMIENFHTIDNKRMWPALARYAAIVEAPTSPRAYPVTIHLIRHYRTIPPPVYHVTDYETHEFYTQTFAGPVVKS